MDPYIKKDMNSLQSLIFLAPDNSEKNKNHIAVDIEKAVTTKSIFPEKDQEILNAFSEIMAFCIDLNKDYVNVNDGGQKYSRRLYNLTHSYVMTFEGNLFQILHQSPGRFPHQKKDSQKIVIGAGGFKCAKIVLDSHGHKHVMSIVHPEMNKSAYRAIEATKIANFKKCDYLLVGYCVKYVNTYGDVKIAFLTPYMNGGDMEHFGKEDNLSFKQIISAGLQVARGLQVVHKEGWAHLDVKPSNLFYFINDSGDFVVKLADFDLARDVTALPQDTKIDCGSYGYASPEILQGSCIGKNGAQQNDIFSLGITLLEIAGFSIKDIHNHNFEVNYCKNHQVTKDSMSKQVRKDMEIDMELSLIDFMANFTYKSIQHLFEAFKLKFPLLTKNESQFLDFAMEMINPQAPELRPTIDQVVTKLEVLAQNI